MRAVLSEPKPRSEQNLRAATLRCYVAAECSSLDARKKVSSYCESLVGASFDYFGPYLLKHSYYLNSKPVMSCNAHKKEKGRTTVHYWSRQKGC
jgi:hypothetical protein